MKAKIAVLLLLALFSSGAYADCDSDRYPYGVPTGLQDSTLTSCRAGYVVKFNPTCKIPEFSQERLTREMVEAEGYRSGSFKADPGIPKELQANDSDYYKSGYDKGHMAPANDFEGSLDLMKDSFLYSNAVPQAPSNNRGVWKRLENYTRNYAVDHNLVYVFTGAIVGPEHLTMGNNVCVPTQLYKVIVNTADSTTEAFLIPNTNEATQSDLEVFRVDQATIESLTKIQFTPLRNTDGQVAAKPSL